MKTSSKPTKFRRVLACAAVAFASAGGCDDVPAPPPAPPPPAEVPEAPAEPLPPARPTTQALTAGPRTTVPLGGHGLTIELPPGWTADELDGGSVLVAGPTPAGEAEFSVTRRPDAMGQPIEELPLEVADGAHGATQWMAGGVRFVARELGRRQGSGGGEEVRWIVSLAVPADVGVRRFEAVFFGTDAGVYAVDREFLTGVVSSIRPAEDNPLLGP